MLYFPLKKSWAKYLTAWVCCFLLRLIPGRPPNIEPILATIMPLSKSFGVIDSILFSFSAMVAFDVFTGKVGIWTLVTAGAYGIVAASAYAFFHYSRTKNRWGYGIFSIIGTLLFDALTGLTIGPIFYGQPFMEALTGQIPFTVNHLLGNLLLALVLSPLIERWITENPSLQFPVTAQRNIVS